MKLTWIMIPLLAAAFALAQSGGNDLLQQGLRKERSEGNYKAAIEIYRRILKQYASDRKLAATALLQIAHCQEREGSKEARASYERLVHEFSDQSQAVNEARARITALETAPSSTPRVRQLWAGNDVDSSGSVSPDGRWLTFANWETGDLGVRDLANGVNKLLTNTGGWSKSGGDFAQDSRFSPDGKRIAYSWFTRKTAYELRVMNSDGTGVRSFGWANTGYVVPLAWSPDGARILADYYGPDGLDSLHLVSIDSGQHREIVPPARRSISGAGFSPDGKWIVMDSRGAETAEADIYIMPADGGKLDTLEANPANDINPSWSQDGTSVLFVSNRAGSYGVWRLPVRDGKADGPARIVRGELGNRVSPAGFTRGGSFAYTVNLGGFDVYTADFDPVTARRTSEPVLLSQRYPGTSVDPQASPDGRFLAWFAQTGSSGPDGGWVVVVRDRSAAKERVHAGVRAASMIWSPDSTKLMLERVGQRPNSRQLVWLDPDTGSITPFRTIEPTRNPLHPVLSPDGHTLYFTLRPWVVPMPSQDWKVMAMDVATGEQRELYRTDARPLFGLALSPDGRTLATIRQVPDINATGELDFELTLVPANGGQARVAAAFRAQRASVAGSFTPDGKSVLALLNSANPPGSQTIVTDVAAIDLATGKLEPIGLRQGRLTALSLDSSGKQLLFSAGSRKLEVWIAENILEAK
jgi:Tol biopolymer transport system component